MKIEKRGKYAGVKVHLEPDEAEAFIQAHEDCVKAGGQFTTQGISPQINYFTLSTKLGKKIKQLLVEEPNLLQERTPEEIQHELETEYKSAALKLEAIQYGKDWKEIHVK